MPLNILTLSANARDTILSYIDNQSILRMRQVGHTMSNKKISANHQVSKTAKESADISFVRTQKTNIQSLECKVTRRIKIGRKTNHPETNHGYAVLAFDFENRGICSIWRTVFDCITNNLNMPPFHVIGSHEVRYFPIPLLELLVTILRLNWDQLAANQMIMSEEVKNA